MELFSIRIQRTFQLVSTPNIVYRTIYISCNQFSQFMQGIGKFVLKLNEPNPNNRNSP